MPYEIPVIVGAMTSLLLMGLIAVRSGTIFNPINIVIAASGSLLYMSNFSLGGLIAPSPRTQLLVLTALLSIGLGGLVAKTKPMQSIAYTAGRNAKRRKLMYGGILLTLPFLALFVAQAISAYSLHTVLSASLLEVAYRREIATGTHGYLGQIHGYFVLPLLWAAFFIGCARWSLYQEWRAPVIISLLIIVPELLMGSRSRIVIVLFAFALVFWFRRERRGMHRKNYLMILPQKAAQFGLIAALASSLVVLSIYRAPGMYTTHGLTATGLHYFVNYATLNFTLLDVGLNERPLMRSYPTLGLATFGWPEQLLEAPLRRIDPGYRSVQRDFASWNSEPIFVGYKSFRGLGDRPLYMNGFYGSLYLAYLDGRVFGIIALTFWYGLFLQKNYLRYRKYHDERSLALTIVLLLLGYTSLTNTWLDSSYFWPMMVTLWAYYNVVWAKGHAGQDRGGSGALGSSNLLDVKA
jgi:hypothetical protein